MLTVIVENCLDIGGIPDDEDRDLLFQDFHLEMERLLCFFRAECTQL